MLAAGGDDTRAGVALEKLCRDSWRPLYAYARRWGCTPEDAEDAVQGFLASMLVRHSLSQVQAGRGRFRSFLLAGMRNHLSDVHSRTVAAKRGGRAAHISLDAETAEKGYCALAVDAETPEKAFERVWAMEIMARSRDRLARECADSGKAAIFAALFPDSAEQAEIGGPENYAELSARLGSSEQALRSLAMRLRRRWRDLIREELSQGVASSEALEEEMASLRAALS